MKLFLNSVKCWIGAFFILGGIGSVTTSISSALLGVLIGIALFVPDFLYYKKPAAELWKKWDATHNSQKQLDRIERAQNGSLTPLMIDKDAKYGRFVGSTNGKYFTTLHKCSCPDFKKRHVPCKHMYFLANDLDVL